MVEINGDNTFYLNRVLFWFYAVVHQYIFKCFLSSNFEIFWKLKYVTWKPINFFALQISFWWIFCASFERFLQNSKKHYFLILHWFSPLKYPSTRNLKGKKKIGLHVTCFNFPKNSKLDEMEHLTIYYWAPATNQKRTQFGKMYCHH